MDFKLLLEGEEYISENIVEVLPKVFGLHKNFRTGLFTLNGITLSKKVCFCYEQSKGLLK